MNNYNPPAFLNQRFPLFEQRWDLREQFYSILILMDVNKKMLYSLLNSQPTKKKQIHELLQQIDAFKIWSWREVDMDEYFYSRIQEFDRKTFELLKN